MQCDEDKSPWTKIVEDSPESYPRADTPVLVIEKRRHIPVVAFVSWRLVWVDSQTRKELGPLGVLAWMPLPPAYKEEEKL